MGLEKLTSLMCYPNDEASDHRKAVVQGTTSRERKSKTRKPIKKEGGMKGMIMI